MQTKFEVYPDEVPRIEKWKEDHKKQCPDSLVVDEIGGTCFYIMFGETNVGTGTWIRCNACNEQESVTDYGTW